MLTKKAQTKVMVSKYRAELKSVIKPSFYLSLGMGLPFLAATFIKEDFNIDPKMIQVASISTLFSFIFCLILMGVCTFFYKITIYKGGLSSYNPWENFRCYHMEWADMKYLIIKNVLGCKYYYIISSDQQECLWVPCNIKNKKQFINDLKPLINDNHILIQHI